MKCINIFAGPGAGKSTTAAGLFWMMKCEGYKVELVREYIKDAVYEKRNLFDDQMYIFAKQNRRQHILRNEVDWIITDSPLLLSAVYAPENYYPAFSELCLQTFESYDNYNFLLTRVKPYVNLGRGQTEKEARGIDERVMLFMKAHYIDFARLDGDKDAPGEILKLIKEW